MPSPQNAGMLLPRVQETDDRMTLAMTHTMTPARRKSRALSTNEKWAAVLSRDKSYDGRFFYAVASTGIFCRPSCPSRRPNKSNVTFHETTSEARGLGFRPCKKCRPDQTSADQHLSVAIIEACRTIEASPERLSLGALADAAGLSRFHFHRAFKKFTGVTPKAYADQLRHIRIRDQLKTTQSVTEAIYGAGFQSSAGFYARSREALGMTPSDFKKGGAGMDIEFAVKDCSLGAILVAATSKGVCAVLIGDDEGALFCDLKSRFPRANLSAATTRLDKIASRVIAAAEHPERRTGIPLDVQGTAFQRRVWEALKAIPAGTTATYAGIAEQIGKPKSVRAVAGACGANPAAVLIPCHRVIRAGGGLSGYRWGIERKLELLRRETSARPRKKS